jgi:formylglycine-generating enzyme required for sulfatase activity/serine/threonine protein kinase
MPDDDQSLGDQQTYEGGVQPADSSDRSLGDQSTFGGGGESSLSDIGGLTGDADLDMEIVDLSRYEVQETLGKGGMGEVLLATDTRLNRKVAIKRMLGDAAKSQTAVKRFLTEAQSIAALNHFNIVQIHDYGRDKDGPFLIMEYVGGGSLLDKCREGALPLEEAVELTCQLCDGLEMAHDAGIIHRDIKPANILLTTDGLPKLTDFGLARQRAGDTGQTAAGAVLGTLDFMPPEQRKDATLTDARSDLWSLAATLYQLVTGEPPRVIDLDEVPQELRSCLALALKQKQDDRYQTAREFKDALRAAQQGVGTETLEEGSCPGCGTKNPTTRKFCRECALSLEAECLSCSAVMPLWEKVCDSCGTKQVDLLDERRSQMASEQSEAENLLKNCEYDRATEMATALRDEPDPRLQHLKGWAEKFLPRIEQERQQQLEQIGDPLTEAAAHEQAHDYAAGLRVLEKVPEILRETQVSGHSDTVSGVMSRLRLKLDEIKRLDGEIRQRMKARKLNGLLTEVDEYLSLKSGDAELETLREKLQAREEKNAAQVANVIEKAQSLREECRFEAASNALGRIPVELMTQEASDLEEDCDYLAGQRETAMRSLKSAMDTEAYDSGLAKTKEYRDSLEDSSLWDQEFSRALAACQRALKEQQEAEEAARQRRNAAAKRNDILGAIAAVVLLLASGLWIRSSMNANALAEAARIAAQQAARIAERERILAEPPLTNSIGMEFKLLPGGTFTMGEGSEAHQVTLTKAFELGVYEVTQKQYEVVMGTNPSHFKTALNPVEEVSWDDAVEFCQKLSALPAEKKAGYVYRLPTEAEWEYACRAGTTTEYSYGDSDSQLGDYAWYDKNSGKTTHPVGGKKPNAWGLYDMHGNVFEWCQDWHGDYPSGSVTDPTGAAVGSFRVLRGGGWYFISDCCRSAFRLRGTPDYRDYSLGFRVLRSSIK